MTELQLQLESALAELAAYRSKYGDISEEETVCRTQISRLNEISASRPLNREEAQKFDIFVKNLRILQKNNVADHWKTFDGEVGELIKIAENNEQGQ